MAVVIHRVGVAVGKVPPVDIVDEPIAVVVDTVAGDLAGVGPDVGGEVGVLVVDAAVDHRDDHAPRSRRDGPGLGSVDVGVDHAPRLPRVVERPERAERPVVGNGRAGDGEVGLHEGHARRAAGPGEDLLRRGARSHDPLEPFAQGHGPPAESRDEVRGRERPFGADDPRVGPGVDGLAEPLDPLGRGRQAEPWLEAFEADPPRGTDLATLLAKETHRGDLEGAGSREPRSLAILPSARSLASSLRSDAPHGFSRR